MNLITSKEHKKITIDILDDNSETLATIELLETSDTIGPLYKCKIDFRDDVYVNGHHWLDADITDNFK